MRWNIYFIGIALIKTIDYFPAFREPSLGPAYWQQNTK